MFTACCRSRNPVIIRSRFRVTTSQSLAMEFLSNFQLSILGSGFFENSAKLWSPPTTCHVWRTVGIYGKLKIGFKNLVLYSTLQYRTYVL